MNIPIATPANFSSNNTDLNHPTDRSCHWPAGSFAVYDSTVENTPTLYFEVVIYPILLLICTLGNILTVTVLSSDPVKTTTNVYLLGVAISDLCVVWLALPLYIAEVDSSVFSSANSTYFENTMNFEGLRGWWQDTAIQFSDWTLIVFSLERMYAIGRPLRYRTLLTVRRAIVIEVIIFFLASLCSLENLIMWYYVLAHDDGVSPKVMIATPGLLSWEAVQAQAEVGITIAKWIVLAVINVILMALIARHNLVHKKVLMIVQQTSQGPVHPAKQGSTFVLSCCIGCYFFSQLPNVVFKILEISSRPPFCNYNFTIFAQNAARPIVHTISLMHYSVNFLLYCLIWLRFRRQLMFLLRYGCFRKQPFALDPDSMSTSVTQTPGGPNDNHRVGKMSLENGDAPEVQQDISTLLQAAAGHPKLKQMGMDTSEL